jgi:hypothetical protein
MKEVQRRCLSAVRKQFRFVIQRNARYLNAGLEALRQQFAHGFVSAGWAALEDHPDLHRPRFSLNSPIV